MRQMGRLRTVDLESSQNTEGQEDAYKYQCPWQPLPSPADSMAFYPTHQGPQKSTINHLLEQRLSPHLTGRWRVSTPTKSKEVSQLLF